MTVKQSLDSIEVMRNIIASKCHSPDSNLMIEQVLDSMKDEEPDLWNGRLTREEADIVWTHLMNVSEKLRLELIEWRNES